MKHLFWSSIASIVILLTQAGCSFVHDQVGEECKSRAYIQMNLADFISERFRSNAPVRLAIIPFTVPANLATRSIDQPGLDTTFTARLHEELLRRGIVPIVEVLNRHDWPGKKEEFSVANFGSLSFAKEAGYDFVLVGQIEPLRAGDRMAANAKLIEVESGITLYYGRTEAFTWRGDGKTVTDTLGITKRRPDINYSFELNGELARCVADEIAKDTN
jgi:hypothetical protein